MNFMLRRVTFGFAVSAATLLAMPLHAQLTQDAVFWVDGTSKLGRVNLDGSGFQVLFNNLTNPISIDVDTTSQQVYWIEGTSFPYYIKRANYDGSGLQTVLTATPAESFFGIAIENSIGQVFWTQKTVFPSGQGQFGFVKRMTTALVPLGTVTGSGNGGPFPRLVDANAYNSHVYFTPGMFGTTEGSLFTGSTEPYFPGGAGNGLAAGDYQGTPLVFYSNGGTIESFDATIPFPPPTTTTLPVPVAPAPINGIDYGGFLGGRLVWGTVGVTQSQIFTSLVTGAGYQTVYTGPEKFVDVALAHYVPPIPEPTGFSLMISCAILLFRVARPSRLNLASGATKVALNMASFSAPNSRLIT